MKIRINRKVSAAAAILAIAGVGLIGATSADAAPLPAVAGNVTMLPSMVRIYGASNPLNLAAGGSSTTTIAGETFGGVAIPDNTTGVTLSVSTIGVTGATGSGQVRVWTTGAPEPGTPAVFFDADQGATNLAFVALDSNGQINIKAVDHATKVLVGIINYVTPVPAPCTSHTTVIAPSDKALEHIGPSVRTDNATPGSGVTDFGHVNLPAGTYDMAITGGFAGLKRTVELPAGTSLRGYLGVTKGAGITSTFSTVLAQTQGIEIPKTNSGSDTYTIDPTVQLNGRLILATATDVHLNLYAYDTDGVDRSALAQHANIQSAQFNSVC